MIALAIITIYIIIASSSDHDDGRLPRCHPRRCSKERMADPMLLGEEGDDARSAAVVVVVVDDDVAEPALAPPDEAVAAAEVDAHDGQGDVGGHRGQGDAAPAGGVARRCFGLGFGHGLDGKREHFLGIEHVSEELSDADTEVGGLDADLVMWHGLSRQGCWWWKTLLKANNGAFKSACHQIIKSVYP